MHNHSSLMAEWCEQFPTRFHSKWSRFSHRSPKSTDVEQQRSRKYRKKGDVFFALVWSNKRINQNLGLPTRFAPGIRLRRKAEKSVHFLLRWFRGAEGPSCPERSGGTILSGAKRRARNFQSFCLLDTMKSISLNPHFPHFGKDFDASNTTTGAISSAYATN